MKKTLIFALIISSFTISCGKDDPAPAPAGGESYMSLSANSTRTYEFTNNTPPTPPTTYTITSTNRDTSINSKQYHIFSSTSGGFEYYNQTGSDYYDFQVLPTGLGDAVENLYLKSGAAVNATWVQTFNLMVQGISVPVTITNKIVEKGITRTVNNISYSNVIHVSTSISSLLIPSSALTSDIHTYYAPRVGLIENTTIIDLNFMGVVNNTNTRTILKSATIL